MRSRTLTGKRALILTLTTLLGLSACATILAPTSALALPEGRHYEMVSPEYKGGYGVVNLWATALQGPEEGNAVVFSSDGTFAGDPLGAPESAYIGRRSSEGWSTSSLLAPQKVATVGKLDEISPTLQGLYYGTSGPNALASEEESQTQFFFHDLLTPDSAANFLTPETETGPGFGVTLRRLDGKPWPVLGSRTADPGFCNVVFRGNGSEGVSSNHEEGERALLPEAKRAHEQIYELVTGAPGCNSERALRLVAVNNHLKTDGEHELIEPQCTSTQGEGINAVAGGGSEVFFTPCAIEAGRPAPPTQLFVRLGRSRTVEVSRPLGTPCVGKGVVGEVPCAGAEGRARAEFQGANEAGTRVFFTTPSPLVSGDEDTGNDLYMAQIGCPAVEPECEAAAREVTSLVQVSHAPTAGEAAEVQGFSTALAENGERVYFVAHGVLSGVNGEGSAPVKGAENLYVYDLKEGASSDTAAMHFVADLCSGPQLSGEALDRHCPKTLDENGRNDDGLWSRDYREAQTTGNGESLVFSSFAQLLAGDTDTARDVYRYDAQSETLDRVSLGENGFDANGNNNTSNAEIPSRQFGQVQVNDEQGSRAVSEDGSRIVFETAEPLSPDVTNKGLTEAYEWHEEPGWSEGRVGLVSDGGDETPVGEEFGGSHLVKEVMITPSGRDIFFLTTRGLVPQDTDGAEDVYDARLGGAFPTAPAKLEECKGDACQGPLTDPAPLLVAGSVSQAAGENVAGPAPVTVVKARKRPNPKCRKGKKRSHGRCVASKARKAGRVTNKRRARR